MICIGGGKNVMVDLNISYVSIVEPFVKRDIFLNFWKNKVWYFIRIVCQQTILMKYHALFVIFEKAVQFEIVDCGKLSVAL